MRVVRVLTLVVIGSISILYPLLALADRDPVINFADAVRLALDTNPAIHASAARIEASRALITESRGNALPKLDLEMNAASSNNPLNVFGYKLSQGNASFKDFGFAQYKGPTSINVMPTALDSPSYYSNVNTGIVLNVPLYAGGGNVAKIKSAQALLKAARHGNAQTRAQLVFEVFQAYEGVHATTRLVQVANGALHAAVNYVKLTRELYHLSTVIKSDVLLAEANRRNAAYALQAAKAERKNQLDTFRILIGKPDSSLIPGAPVQLHLSEKPADKLTEQALFANSELLALKSRIVASRAGVQAARAQDWPQVNLLLRHDWNAKTPQLSGTSNTALLTMNWQLFSSGAQSGAENFALAKYQQTKAEYEKTLDDIRLAVVQAKRESRLYTVQLQTASENAHAATQIVGLLKQRYKRGVVNINQLLDGQARLDTARAQQALARYHRLIAEAKILLLINELNSRYEFSKA